MIYQCENCEKYFTEDEIEEQRICIENELGVGGQFDSRHYATVYICPYCGSEDMCEAEIDESEVCDLLNG